MRYIAKLTYQTPLGNVGTYTWDGQAESHEDADLKAKNSLRASKRHKPVRAIDGSTYLVFWEKNASSSHSA